MSFGVDSGTSSVTNNLGPTSALTAGLAALLHILHPAAWHLAPLIVAPLVWQNFFRRSFVRWSWLLHALLRLEYTLLVARPTRWGSYQLSQWQASQSWFVGISFGVALLVRSHVPVMLVSCVAHWLPLWLHVPLQLLLTGAAALHNQDQCGAPLEGNEVLQRYMLATHRLFKSIFLSPTVPGRADPPQEDSLYCRRVMLMLQVTAGFALPTLALAHRECRQLLRAQQQKWLRQQEQQGKQQMQQTQSQQQQQQQQVEKEGKLEGLGLQEATAAAAASRWAAPQLNGAGPSTAAATIHNGSARGAFKLLPEADDPKQASCQGGLGAVALRYTQALLYVRPFVEELAVPSSLYLLCMLLWALVYLLVN